MATTPILETLSETKLRALLAKLETESSALCDEFIASGRGAERPSETRLLSDPLALRWKFLATRQDLANSEARRRKEWHGSLKPIRRAA